MTASELKYLTRVTSPYFFTRQSMNYFGDTMANYGVSKVKIAGNNANMDIDIYEFVLRNSKTLDD